MRVEDHITEEKYIEKNKQLEDKLKSIRTEKEMHEGADKGFKKTVMTSFELANQASQLFKSSKTSEKRELINFVFSNLKLRGKNLEFTLRKPFDLMVEMNERSAWLPSLDKFRTFLGEIKENIERGRRVALING